MPLYQFEKFSNLVIGAELDCFGAPESLTGVSWDSPESDCLLDLSLFKTKLALLMNLANPRGLSSCPPEPPWPEELIFVEDSC